MQYISYTRLHLRNEGYNVAYHAQCRKGSGDYPAVGTPVLVYTPNYTISVGIIMLYAQLWALQATVLKTSLGEIILCTTKAWPWTPHLCTYLLSATHLNRTTIRTPHTSLVWYSCIPVVIWCPVMQGSSQRYSGNNPCIA